MSKKYFTVERIEEYRGWAAKPERQKQFPVWTTKMTELIASHEAMRAVIEASACGGKPSPGRKRKPVIVKDEVREWNAAVENFLGEGKK